jgi:sterol desaturase/sphingolipid hydroxylase (fatty acid hydroxylase superfamily)
MNSIFIICFFIVLALWQYYRSKKPLLTPLKTRWGRHFALFLIGQLCIQMFCFSVVPLSIAVEVSKHKTGILNSDSLINLPISVRVVLGILMLDWVVYLQHRFFHKIPLAWRFHKVHHTDKELEISTGLRFHPIEQVILFIVKASMIVIAGLPVLSVLLYEILLNGALLFTHANIDLPPKIERFLRYFMVTPLMHRIHHSDLESEHHSNFGFVFSIWDRLGSSYTAYPKFENEQMNIGLKAYRDSENQTLKSLLWLPFRPNRPKSSIRTKSHMSAVS